jgi:hypothetical protein
MRLSTVCVVSFLILSGCATSPKGWEKSGVERSQLETDQAQCDYEAKAATASYHTSTSTKQSESERMGDAIGDGIVIAEKQVELKNACMKAKGYRAQ